MTISFRRGAEFLFVAGLLAACTEAVPSGSAVEPEVEIAVRYTLVGEARGENKLGELRLEGAEAGDAVPIVVPGVHVVSVPLNAEMRLAITVNDTSSNLQCEVSVEVDGSRGVMAARAGDDGSCDLVFTAGEVAQLGS
jgi:hypothetical protein